jgi:AP2-associated kinase
MRRGRPTAPVAQPAAARPSPSPMRGTTSDPFAALDSQSVQERSAAADELAARFPSLDEFSLLHDRGKKFEFGQTPTTPDPQLSQRVTQALADEAFAFPATKVESVPAAMPSPAIPSVAVSRSASTKKTQPSKDSTRQPNISIQQPTPHRHGMVSTGIQTSPSPSPAPQVPQKFDVSKRPIWRVPESAHHNRAMSQPRTFEKPLPSPSSLRPDYTMPSRPSLSDARSKSQASTLTIPKSPASSRPSLETQRPSAMDIGYAIDRSKSANSNARPTSMHVESNLDYLRDRERSSGRSFDQYRGPPSAAIQDSDSELEDKNITSNVDFLRAIEDDGGQKKHRRSSSQSKHTKRTSLSSITSNTKNIVKGRFGDAFRRFESNSSSGNQDKDRDLPVTPTEQKFDPRTGKALTPIAGSEATGDQSDDERAIDETQDLSPEVRRELERRRLSQEERRVEAAAAEYRQKLILQDGKGGKSGPTRASTIQNRVRSLLDDSSKTVTPSRTAEGYGKYTKPPAEMEKPLPTRPQDHSQRQPPAIIARKPISIQPQLQPSQDLAYTKPRATIPVQQFPHVPQSASAPPLSISRVAPASTGPRPSAPPKPKALRTGGTADFSTGSGGLSPSKQAQVYKQSPTIRTGEGGEEWDLDTFSKRYPSLSGLEMVETEIEIPVRRGPGGVRDL